MGPDQQLEMPARLLLTAKPHTMAKRVHMSV